MFQLSLPARRFPRLLRAAAVLALPAIASLACADFGTFRTATVEPAAEPFVPGKCTTETTLLWEEPPPAEAVGGLVPEGVEVVEYPAPPGPLRGWVMRPEGDGPHPTLVFFHGGMAWSPAHAEVVRDWVDAGWVVFMPALRGENGNPGTYQLLCGEVDDAAAAVRWAAKQPYVDDEKLVTFGHSLGGSISGLLALHPDLPIAASGSVGGLYFPEVIQGWGPMVPFDPSDRSEQERRLLVAHMAELKRPHLAWMGRDDALHAVVEPARAEAERTGAPLQVLEVDGNHQTSMQPGLEAFRTSSSLQSLVQ